MSLTASRTIAFKPLKLSTVSRLPLFSAESVFIVVVALSAVVALLSFLILPGFFLASMALASPFKHATALEGTNSCVIK